VVREEEAEVKKGEGRAKLKRNRTLTQKHLFTKRLNVSLDLTKETTFAPFKKNQTTRKTMQEVVRESTVTQNRAAIPDDSMPV
jgi:hypothetical protein